MSRHPEPAGDDLVVELRRGRRVRMRVTAMFVVVSLLVVGALGYDRWQRAHACDRARAGRQVDEQLHRELFSELGHRLNASQDEIDEFHDVIEFHYDRLPEPAAC